jgi:hypothetical protein
MTLSAAAIGRFKVLAKKELNLDLTDAEAGGYATRLLTLVRAVVEAPQPRGRGPPLSE